MGGVLSLVGDVILRRDEYVGRGDVVVPLEGVYETASGTARAHGSARTTGEFGTMTNASAWTGRFREGSLFRESLRAIAADVLEGRGGGREDARRDSYARDAAVRRAPRAWRDTFLATHDAGTYPSACQFSFHAYLTPGSYAVQQDTTKRADEEEEEAKDVLDAQLEDQTRPLEFMEMSESVSLVGKLVSENCGIVVHMELESLKLEKWYRKVRLYSFGMIAVTMAQGYALLKQLEASSTQATLMRLSLASIGMRSVVDSYLCLAHLTAGIVVDDLFMPLGLVAACYFVLFSVLEMKLLVAAWRVRRPDITSWVELRVQLGAIYSRFYAAFIVGLFIMFWLSDRFFLFILLANSYWLPQIWRIAYHNHRQALKPSYVVATSCARVVAPLYALGCPTNFMRIRPNYFHCALVVLWTAAQCGMLLAQHYIKPRYGLPIGIFPEVYDYHRTVPADVLAQCGIVETDEDVEPTERDIEMGDVSSGVDCVICMNTVKTRDVNERMVTPCNHFFHTKCLTRWMDIKQECPTCRRALPPM